MNPISVLIIDDDAAVIKAISAVLKHENINSSSAMTGKDALCLLRSQSFDLILLDIMLPDQDGLSVLRELRLCGNLTPVIILSGKDEDADQVEGLQLGADDYVTKPFSKTVLVSKIKAVIRRTTQYAPAKAPSDSLQTAVHKGDFELHFDSQTVIKDGREISLSSKEFALLCFFLENPNTTLSKQEIFSGVWKSETPDDNSILVYIKRLRDKIEDNPSKPKYLTTVWGKGYQFNIVNG